MVRTEGNATTQVSATGHRPLPMATDTVYRKAHTPAKPKPTGLDWSKHRAPEADQSTEPAVDEPKLRRCRWCRTPQTGLVDGLCQPCRTDAEQQFTPPTPKPSPPRSRPTLQEDLDELEKTDPDVAAAAASYDDMVDRVTRPLDHVRPPAPDFSSTDLATLARFADAPDALLDEEGDIAAKDIRPAVTPSPAVLLDQLIDDLATVRATLTTRIARIENALETVRKALVPTELAPALMPSDAATTVAPAPKPRAAATRRRSPRHAIDVATVVRRYAAGEGVPAIAADLGHSTSTIRRALREAGAPMRDDRAHKSGGRNAKTIDDYDPEFVAQIRCLYVDEKQSIDAIAATTSRSRKYITTILNRAGVTMRPPGANGSRKLKLDDTRRAEICRRYQAGESTVALGRAYGVSNVTIASVLDRNGIPRRSPAAARRNALTHGAPDHPATEPISKEPTQ